MFGWGKSKACQELDRIRQTLQLACENNYKDSAQANFRQLKQCLDTKKENKELKEKEITLYEQVISEYEEKMVHFHH